MNTIVEPNDLLAVNDGQSETFFRVSGSEGASVVLLPVTQAKPDTRNQIKVPACILAAGIHAGGIGVYRPTT